MPKYPLLIAFTLLSACAKTVDLGQDQSETWRDAPAVGADRTLPQTVYQGGVRVVAFTVDETNLYALLEDFSENDRQLRLVSCPADHCQTQRTTLFSASMEGDVALVSQTELLLAKGKLYWLSGYGDPASGIARCSTAGCSAGPQDLVETAGPRLMAIATDGDFVYWLDNEAVMRRAADGTGESESLYRWDIPGPIPMASQIIEFGDYLYLSGDLNAGGDSAVFRIRKDGRGTPELIAHGVNIAGLALSSSGVYFTTAVLTGKVLHCPLSGCASAPEEVVTNQRWPNGIRIANDAAYFVTGPPTPAGYPDERLDTLLTSQLTERSSPRVVADDLEFGGSDFYSSSVADFALNQNSVFWRESTPSRTFSIKRLPR